jgi:hypothetical protein
MTKRLSINFGAPAADRVFSRLICTAKPPLLVHGCALQDMGDNRPAPVSALSVIGRRDVDSVGSSPGSAPGSITRLGQLLDRAITLSQNGIPG